MEPELLGLSGDGDGYGYGYGNYGYGDGDGDGDGNGNNKTMSSYITAFIASNVSHQPPNTTLALWRCTKDNTPANKGTNTVAIEGYTEEVEGPLEPCTEHALHGTLNPSAWKGENYWLVALHEPVIILDDKLASLKRTFLKNLGRCPF